MLLYKAFYSQTLRLFWKLILWDSAGHDFEINFMGFVGTRILNQVYGIPVDMILKSILWDSKGHYFQINFTGFNFIVFLKNAWLFTQKMDLRHIEHQITVTPLSVYTQLTKIYLPAKARSANACVKRLYMMLLSRTRPYKHQMQSFKYSVKNRRKHLILSHT